jgi:hypothetical protein
MAFDLESARKIAEFIPAGGTTLFDACAEIERLRAANAELEKKLAVGQKIIASQGEMLREQRDRAKGAEAQAQKYKAALERILEIGSPNLAQLEARAALTEN